MVYTLSVIPSYGAIASQVSLFAIKDGRVFFRNKFVRTEALMREQEAQKVHAVCCI